MLNNASQPEFQIFSLTPQEARVALWENDSPNRLVMCRGYSDEDDVFTELVWEDDWDLEFEDAISYPEFQLWVFDSPDQNEAAA